MVNLMQQILGTFYWDPDRVFFTIPGTDHPIVWYGVLFVAGFFIGYLLGVRMLTEKLKSSMSEASAKALSAKIMDRVLWYTIIGTVVGARLGLVFFYEWDYFKDHPLDIFKIWEGGLASHGGFTGVIIALIFFYWRTKKDVPEMNFLNWLDLLVVPISLVCVFIRLGNFMNQEIVGQATDLPWGVIFGHPAERVSTVARHPVVLYEALAYFLVFLFLLQWWWVKEKTLPAGLLSGVGILLLTTARFFLEPFKLKQMSHIDQSYLEVGQLLCIPFLLLGLGLVVYALANCPNKRTKRT